MDERFIFPFAMVEKGKKIIIYGAGNIGKELYSQMIITEYCKVVHWVDSNAAFYQEKGLDVEDIHVIDDTVYDYIIIAIGRKDVADSVIKTLIDNYHVDKSKIIWNDYAYNCLIPTDIRYDEIDYDEGVLELINPKDLLDGKNMELIVRYILAKDIKKHIYIKQHMSLYQRFCMTVSLGREDLNEYQAKLFTDYDKKEGLDVFVDKFKELVASMEKEGFIKEKFIPVTEKGKLINGKHRFAAALALEEDIWIKTYTSMEGYNMDIDWFKNNGFSSEDIALLLYSFCEVYVRCGMFLLFGSMKSHWEYITAQIKKTLNVVGYLDYDFKDNWIGFCNLIRDNYWDNDHDWANIEEKLHFLLMSPLQVRVVVVSANDQCDLYNRIKDKKNEIRKIFWNEIKKDTLIIHGSDSFYEYDHMKNIWLNTNSIKYAAMRVLNGTRMMMNVKMKQLKKYLSEMRIPHDHVCILGSAGMELYGLRVSDDLDFCVHPIDRYKVIQSKLPKDVNLKRQNSVMVGDGVCYTDEMIIEEPDFHYMFNGLKFLNLDILRNMKKYRNMDKDVVDVRLIDIFYDSLKAFDDKELVRKQMESQLNRRY
ncbi:hypothetical protein SAMN05216390_108111 [Lachnospiraceae bacterium KH1T2]|nr:hypothetical protein SAMN05216390_108111 [Lachnospiraceae bacterium KH1T2]